MILTLDNLTDHATEDCDCLLWTKATNHSGHPIAKIDGRCVSVRRHVFNLAGGKLIGQQRVGCICGNTACIAPAHLKPMKPGEIVAQSWARGERRKGNEYATFLRGRMRDHPNRRNAMSEEVRQAIKAFPPGTRLADIGKAVGYSGTAVGNFLNGKTYRETANGASAFTWRP